MIASFKSSALSLIRNTALAIFLLACVGCVASEDDETKKAALGILQEALKHENFFVRSAAIKAIGEMGDAKRVSSVLPGFRDSVSFVRMFSVESAAQLRGPDTLKLLLAAGADPDPMVRIAVVKALDDRTGTDGKIDTLPIDQLFAPFIKDPDPTVQLFAGASLSRHGDEKQFRLILEAAQVPETASPAVVALGRTKKKEAVPILIKALQTEEAMIRTLATEALGEISSGEAYAPLAALVTKDKEATVRGAAATSLGKIKNPKAIPILIEAVGDPEPMVQLSAAEGLMRLGTKRLDIYEKGLHHADYGVRHFAIGSLQKAAGQEALPLLTAALADEAPRVRIAAVRAIGAIGGKNEAPILKKMLQDADLSVRAYAAGNMIRLLSGVQRAAGATR